MSPLDRRQLLESVAAGGALAALPGAQAAQPPAQPAQKPNAKLIQQENARDGTTDWQLTYTRVDPKTRFRSTRIEGYVSKTSVRAGETLDFFVSTNPPHDFVIDIYR